MLLGRPLQGEAGGCVLEVLEGLGVSGPNPGILAATSLLVSAAPQLSEAELRDGASDVLGWMMSPLSNTAQLAASIRCAVLIACAFFISRQGLLLYMGRLLRFATCCGLAAMPFDPSILQCGSVHPYQYLTDPAGQKG